MIVLPPRKRARRPAALRWATALVGAFSCVLILACAGPDEAVRVDLERYLRRANDWGPVEAETARAIDRILRTQFVDEAEVRRQISADRPRVAAHLETLGTAPPASAPLQAIHARYIENWRALLAGYDDILAGLDGADTTRLARGRAALERWRRGIVAVATSLRDLRQELER
jgi:hypothetical protein